MGRSVLVKQIANVDQAASANHASASRLPTEQRTLVMYDKLMFSLSAHYHNNLFLY